MVSPEPDLGA